VLGRGEDLGTGVVERDRGGTQWAAELAGDSRAADAVEVVFACGREAAELVAGELGGLDDE